MQIGRRQFIATLAAAIIAPQLPAVEVLPLVPPISPFWSGTLPPATGVLTFEMLERAFRSIEMSIGIPQPLVVTPWMWEKTMQRLEADDRVARARLESSDANDQDHGGGDA